MSETVMWIDESEQELGEVTLERAHAEGHLHRIAVVYLTNEKHQILVQRRASGRLDHSAAGHVEAGETYLQAATRELEEELGVSGVTLDEIGDCIVHEKGSKKFHKLRVFQCQAAAGKLNQEEVREVFWADPHAVWQDMQVDSEEKRYLTGFKATLELYLNSLQDSPVQL